MGTTSTFWPAFFSKTDVRPMASSPMRLSRRPPPTTMRSVRRQAFSLRKRWTTAASSDAKFLDGALDDARGFGLALRENLIELFLAEFRGRRFSEWIVSYLSAGARARAR